MIKFSILSMSMQILHFNIFILPLVPTYWMMKVSHTQYNDLEELEEAPHQHLLKLKQKIGVI